MPKLRNGSKGDSNQGSLYCESDILPPSYRASQSTFMRENNVEEIIKVRTSLGLYNFGILSSAA